MSSRKVIDLCARLLNRLGPELYILKDAPLEDIQAAGGAPMREAIRRIRCGEMAMDAGYDGEFGSVKVFTDKERKELLGRTGRVLEGFDAETEPPPVALRGKPNATRS